MTPPGCASRPFVLILKKERKVERWSMAYTLNAALGDTRAKCEHCPGRLGTSINCREVQPDFTLEIEVSYMLFERCHIKIERDLSNSI